MTPNLPLLQALTRNELLDFARSLSWERRSLSWERRERAWEKAAPERPWSGPGRLEPYERVRRCAAGGALSSERSNQAVVGEQA